MYTNRMLVVWSFSERLSLSLVQDGMEERVLSSRGGCLVARSCRAVPKLRPMTEGLKMPGLGVAV